jgi:hypothetical protein
VTTATFGGGGALGAASFFPQALSTARVRAAQANVVERGTDLIGWSLKRIVLDVRQPERVLAEAATL